MMTALFKSISGVNAGTCMANSPYSSEGWGTPRKISPLFSESRSKTDGKTSVGKPKKVPRKGTVGMTSREEIKRPAILNEGKMKTKRNKKPNKTIDKIQPYVYPVEEQKAMARQQLARFLSECSAYPSYEQAPLYRAAIDAVHAAILQELRAVL